MSVFNIGSINIDHVYEVDHFVLPGETLASTRYTVHAGGKGFNQSIALARAGVSTFHLGKVGSNAEWLVRFLNKESVDTTFVVEEEGETGHAVIQVVPSGENSIVLFHGANRAITEADITIALDACSKEDAVLMQNETSSVAHAIHCAHRKGLKVVFNPAPMSPEVLHYPLSLVDLFILNETEAEQLTGKTHPEEIQKIMQEKYPHAATVLTRGSKGAVYFDADQYLETPAPVVEAVDTTAAGDTFVGFFLAELLQTADAERALKWGCRAAAHCVTQAGAAGSIPLRSEVEGLLNGRLS